MGGPDYSLKENVPWLAIIGMVLWILAASSCSGQGQIVNLTWTNQHALSKDNTYYRIISLENQSTNSLTADLRLFLGWPSQSLLHAEVVTQRVVLLPGFNQPRLGWNSFIGPANKQIRLVELIDWWPKDSGMPPMPP